MGYNLITLSLLFYIDLSAATANPANFHYYNILQIFILSFKINDFFSLSIGPGRIGGRSGRFLNFFKNERHE